ncbi:hypothetical protein KC19_5G072900 [Ceratodon purpureus]|uniref:Uncharacterized protein n=1 Tax=Ceratodon purpureus TaxID=3225 RepID=A0A8T0I131_CERPU|nr:hypothetical protein KC19_5G072900 [Ceratodon purpureus]
MAQLGAMMATGCMHGSMVRPAGLGERHSSIFGTGVAFPRRRIAVGSSERREFSRCVKAVSGDGDEKEGVEKGGSWLERVGESMKRVSKPTMAVMLSLMLLESSPDMAALAASGGRVGGRVGGGSSFSSKSFSAPSRSYSAPSRPYSGPSMGGYGAPRQYIAPSPRFSYAVPYAAPSPFFGGGVYAAPAYGLGLGAGGVFFLLIVGFIVLQAFYGFLSERSGLRGSSVLSGTQPVSVLKLQVGLLGMGRSLQKDLDRIAGQADTTTVEGLHYILTETCLALMRHPDYCISGVTSNDINRSISVAEERFNSLSLEERGKFDEETLVNVNNLRKRMQMDARRAERFNNEYIVVTVLVAAEGEYKLPTINGNSDLKDALRKLGSIPADSIQAVEVLWTPQDENDTLSERELLRDYPLLRSL